MALPYDISILEIFEVPPDSSARFDATSRSYHYLISQKKDPFLFQKALYYFGDLNLDEMNKCCELILQASDFQSFSKVKTQVNNFNCTILEARWIVNGSLIKFEIKANRFLRGMVRALVGTMLEVGKGNLAVEDFQKIIESRDRKKAGTNAPAYALYLTKVCYPPHIVG